MGQGRGKHSAAAVMMSLTEASSFLSSVQWKDQMLQTAAGIFVSHL